MLIGAMTTVETSILIMDDESSSDDDEDELLVGDINDNSPTSNDDVDLDAIFIAGVDASRPGSTDAQHLAKVWHISYKDAKRMLDVTLEHSARKQDPMLSQNYAMNERMLQYKCIGEYFFMDMFFATSKGGKSSCRHTCCQLLMIDKEFLYVVPMKQQSEVLQAGKQFSKEIGAPNAIICNMSGEQMLPELKQFCNMIRTTL